MNQPKEEVRNWLESQEDSLWEMAREIWEKPEVGLKEEFASELQSSRLERAGFRIESGIGEMDTAFMAEYGTGGPVVGILGEYDALPGLSQKVKAAREPRVEGEAGHACGHNLLGTAGVGAALAIKEMMEEGQLEGTVRYYGCPAEETLVGKVFMARSGAFDDLDACLTWHPGGINTVSLCASLAMNSVRFRFSGVPAHAAGAPDQGRSALDAVELLNTGSEYMREHISDDARVHYSIPEGGHEPNIVPEEAVAWYYVRAPERGEVESIYDWLKDIAQAAAQMAQVELQTDFLTGCHETLPNEALSEALLENMKELGGPRFGEGEEKLAARLEETFNPGQKKGLKKRGVPEEVIAKTLHGGVIDPYDRGKVGSGSTDVGEVSWITPLAQFNAATWPVGTAGHSWQITAAAGSGTGRAGMKFAAQTLATTLVDLYADPDLLRRAREEFQAETEGKGYSSPLPEGVSPPFDQL